MNDVKSVLQSRTLWANAIGLIALGLGALGYDASVIDSEKAANAITQIVVAGSLLASMVFRVIASKKLKA